MWLVLAVLVPWAVLSTVLALLVGAGIRLRDQHSVRPDPSPGSVVGALRVPEVAR